MRSMWLKILSVIALVLAAAVIFISTIPLQLVLKDIDLPDKLEIQSVDGTVWSGKAQLAWKDARYLSYGFSNNFNLTWKWCPSAGLAAMCFRLGHPNIDVSAYVAYSLLKARFAFGDIAVQMRIKDHAFKYKVLETALNGTAQLRMDDFYVPLDLQMLPENIAGEGAIESLQTKEGFALGAYQFKVVFQDKQLKIPFEGGIRDDIEIEVVGQLDVNFSSPKKPYYRYFVDLVSPEKAIMTLLSQHAQHRGKKKVTFSGGGAV